MRQFPNLVDPHEWANYTANGIQTDDLIVIRCLARQFAHASNSFARRLTTTKSGVVFTPQNPVQTALFVDNNHQLGSFIHECAWIILGGRNPG